MNWLVILCIYSYTAGLLLCFYAGMRIERDTKREKISARVIRPAVITVKPQYHVTEYVAEHPEDLELDFPNTERIR